MVLSEQARRNWRLAAIYGSLAAGIQCVLYADYHLPTDDKHVFTDLQIAYRSWIDRTFFGGGDSAAARGRIGDGASAAPNASSDPNNRETRQ